MGDWSLGSIATRVFDHVQDIPSDVSGSLPNIAWTALNWTNNVLRESTGSNGIGETRQTLVTNVTSIFALQRMHNVGVDFDFTLGEFKVGKGASSGPVQQAEFLMGLVNAELKGIGRRTIVKKANG